MDSVSTWFVVALGLRDDTLDAAQMGLRAIVVYLFAIVLVRFGDKRFLGKHAAIDFILGFILGSVLSRAITGNSPFLPTLFAASVVVALHWAFARIAFSSQTFGKVVKGSHRVLVRDGEIQWDQMKAAQISRHDLVASLRENGHLEDPARVRLAVLERDGSISVMTYKDEE